jgi:hypothetical protein
LLLLTVSCSGEATNASSPVLAPKPVVLQVGTSQPAERRDVIFTGDLLVRVSSLAKATPEAVDLAGANGGFLFSQASDEDSTKLVLKVPSNQFDATVVALAALGKELRRNLNAQDVTSDVVDADGRLKTAQASADRLRALLTEAKTPSDVVAVEGELAKREADIESLQGRLRVLNDQVALATLTVQLTERSNLQVATDLPGFLGGLRTGLVALVNTGQVLLAIGGFLVPFLPLLALVIGLVWRYRRRHPQLRRQAPVARYWTAPHQAAPPDPSGPTTH